MKKLYLIFYLLIISLFFSCSKDNRFAARMAGTWTIETADVYHWDTLSNDFVHTATYNNAGTIKLTDDNKNGKRFDVTPYTNSGVIDIPAGTGSGTYYWSVDEGNDKDAKRIEFMWEDPYFPIYYYFSYSIEIVNRKTQIWTRNTNTNGGMDSGNKVKEVWRMVKE